MEPVGAVRDFQQHVSQYIKEYDCYGKSAERDHVEFMPQIELRRFWTIGKIEDVLCSTEPNILYTGQKIRDHYLVVFSILTFMARPQDISVFIRYDVEDSQLPLLATPTGVSESSCDREVFEVFQKSQWKFCPLTLNMGKTERKPSKRELSPFHIIPVSKTERISPREIGHRDDICLDKVTLHEQCSAYKTVVFKTLRGSSDALKVMYDNEVDMYKNLIREDSFDHIIRYYGSFQSLDVRVIVLEYANGGTLESFFEHQSPPKSKAQRELFWNRLMGLSRGLERIHNLTDSKEYSKGDWMRRGMHQDIHPQNILVCNAGFENMQGFSFKFADMGTGHIRRMRYKGLDEDAMDQEGNGIYSSPEACVNNKGTRGIRGDNDIWALGCVASEALVWCLQNDRGRWRYHNDRIKATQKTILKDGCHVGAFHNGTYVLDTVEEWHKSAIENAGDEADFYNQLSRLILDRMLVAEPRNRADAAELCNEWNLLFLSRPALLAPDHNNLEPSTHSNADSLEWLVSDSVSQGPFRSLTTEVSPATAHEDRRHRRVSLQPSQVSDGDSKTSVGYSTENNDIHSRPQREVLADSDDNFITTDTNRVADASAFTDSGYGSIAHNRGVSEAAKDSTAVDDDTATVLTDNEAMDLIDDEKNSFVERFAALIHGGALSRLGKRSWDTEVQPAMRHLLKSFAIKLSQTEKTSDAKDISTFVRHYRNHITLAIQDIVQDQQAESPNFEMPDDDFAYIRGTEAPLTAEEKFDEWNSGGPGDYEIHEPEGFETDEAIQLADAGNGYGSSSLEKGDLDSIDNVSAERFLKYQEIVVQTHAFEWLLNEISKHAQLSLADAMTIQNIQTSMNEVLGISTVAENKTEIRVVCFGIDWDPYVFVGQQGYDSLQSLECALTLSGTAINAQLLPCRRYLRQCWPNLGEIVLDGILAVMQKGYRNITKLILYDGTSVSLTLLQEGLNVQCKAAVDVIIEVVEIMAWIGSSLREASSKDKVSYVTPRVSQATNDPKVIEHTSRGEKIGFSISFREENIPYWKEGAQSGFCWRGLLGNPVIAKGFPVLLRGTELAGLEVPLPVMASLLDAERLTAQKKTIFLKGFNAAVVPTAIVNDIVHWHLVVNEAGDRLSYNDTRLAIDEKLFSMLTKHEIQKSRHVLGWTLNAVHSVGSSSATYDGLWTSPDFTGSRLVLEKIIVQGGFDPLTIGVEAAIGQKDPAPNIVRRDLGYIKGIESLAGTYIVLYDTRDHRAWLANGASALLHLTRASLRHGLKGPVSKEYVLEESQLKDNASLSSPQAAVNFLCDRDKLQLPIFRELLNTHGSSQQQAQTRFIDCVNHIRHVLEQLIDYQATVSSPGMALTLSPRSRLEGYKFMDLAAGRPITPCAMKLNIFRQGGKSWVDFTRAIKAVTLFGKGFGELMIPASDSITTCSKWQTLPKGRDYLAVSTYDLARIIEERGDFESKKLAPSICWHQPAELFETCACTRKPPGLHRFVPLQRSCDRVQVLLPETPFSSSLQAPSMLPDMLGEGGAVIFGRSRVFAWIWPDEGGPEKDSHVDSVEEDEIGSTESIHSLSEPTPNSTYTGSRSTAPTSLTPGISSADVRMAPDAEASASDASDKRLVEMGEKEKKTLRQRLRGIARRFSLKDDLNKKRGP